MDRFLSFLFCVLAVAACKTHQTAESITPADEAFMREAIRLSVESVARGGGPFGAVIVKDGEILASRSNSVTLDNDPTPRSMPSGRPAAPWAPSTWTEKADKTEY